MTSLRSPLPAPCGVGVCKGPRTRGDGVGGLHRSAFYTWRPLLQQAELNILTGRERSHSAVFIWVCAPRRCGVRGFTWAVCGSARGGERPGASAVGGPDGTQASVLGRQWFWQPGLTCCVPLEPSLYVSPDLPEGAEHLCHSNPATSAGRPVYMFCFLFLPL